MRNSQLLALSHAIELIRRSSITPEDGGCQDYLEGVLAPLGFIRRHVDAGKVTNSIFIRPGTIEGCLAFAGHTDVVPTGPIDSWQFPPFAATLKDKVLHGRGAQDMKGAIACWLAALENLIKTNRAVPTMQILITSDEEGESIDGMIRIVERLQADRDLPDAVIVGEPSSLSCVGDTIRRGRRGVVQGSIEFIGKQGHSAYPADADNAIHKATQPLARIASIDWGLPSDGFPPTSCQITNIEGGTGAMNVIPGNCRATLDIRYNPAIDYEGICKRIIDACEEVEAVIDLQHQAEAFSTPDGSWLDQVCEGIHRITGIEARRDTGGGTSDGRFLAASGVPVVELGLTNDTIHQIGERVHTDELDTLALIYEDIILNFEV